MNTQEKHLEAGFDDAPQMEEGRSPSHEQTVSAEPESPMQLTSGAATLRPTTPASTRALKHTSSWKSILPNIPKANAPYSIERLEDYPNGYPRISCLMNSDVSFAFYRRFGTLRSRLLLHKQDELRELEENLLILDKLDDEDDDTRDFLRCREDADHQEPPANRKSRKQILRESELLLRDYTELIEQAHKLEMMEKPTAWNHYSVTNWFNTERPVFKSNQDFLLHKDDLISIRAGRDHAWLDAAIETVLRWYPCKAVKYLFCDEATQKKTDNPRIIYYSRTRINFLVTLIITILILILLVIPIGVLFYLSLNETSGPGEFLIIGVLMICTLTFSCVLSLFTKARRHELLAASAGYAAVLVVFVGNVGNNLSKPT